MINTFGRFGFRPELIQFVTVLFSKAKSRVYNALIVASRFDNGSFRNLIEIYNFF